jgi:hypothetical protein
MRKLIVTTIFMLAAVGFLAANCGEGYVFTPTGDYYCGYDNNDVFTCWPIGTCVWVCDGEQGTCGADFIAQHPATIMAVKRRLDGKPKQVVRRVIHTEKVLSLDPKLPHVWVLRKSPDGGPTAVTSSAQSGLGPKTLAEVRTWEAMLAEQFAGGKNCCSAK